uniref:Shikimate dehydrogenase (NADP(+)) n=1 Tax=uncultured Chloroflexota bacterium TaxID=166587 RepID=H5SDW8_9CHLR|nr:quinate/shikimate 5-dehydrogenase [uncultured Chloroflexota bacterium]
MTERVGLIGWPLGHSLSPFLHQRAFAACGLDWRYDLLPVEAETLAERIQEWVAQGYRGFNVTIPHKRRVLELALITQRSAEVEALQAANTLVRLEDGSLRAENTDWLGFLQDLQAHGVEVAGASCLILGTGGSAQAVAYALECSGAAEIAFLSRSPRHPRHVSWDVLRRSQDWLERVKLVVNCTPLGMYPQVESSPWPEDLPLPPQAIVYDLVYNPRRTRFLEQAEKQGLPAIGGIGMLLRQAALSFTLWTGREFDFFSLLPELP